jgi:hypothetical protein
MAGTEGHGREHGDRLEKESDDSLRQQRGWNNVFILATNGVWTPPPRTANPGTMHGDRVTGRWALRVNAFRISINPEIEL